MGTCYSGSFPSTEDKRLEHVANLPEYPCPYCDCKVQGEHKSYCRNFHYSPKPQEPVPG